MSYLPPPAFHFRVDFVKFPSNPLKGFGFQEVSGIEFKMETSEISEGGQNRYEHKVPDKITFENLVLRRGMQTMGLTSSLVTWIMQTMSNGFMMPIITTPMSVSLLDENALPIAVWSFFNAYPVKWSIGDLNAEDGDNVLIEELELCYSYFVRTM